MVASKSTYPPFDPETTPTPIFEAKSVCPSCGRARAIVFPRLVKGEVPENAQLVCLDCCPRASVAE
jgi:hypothetical protein